MKYGILKTSVNTGKDSEIRCGFATPLSVISNQPVFAQDMLSLKRRTRSQNVQRWEIEGNIEPSNNSADFLVHSLSTGYDTVFFVRMPQVFGNAPADISPGQSTVTSDAAVKVNTVSISGVLPAVGEFIQFMNHSKVYLVVEQNVNSIKLEPPLLRAVMANEGINRGGYVTMHAYFDTNVKLGITYTDGVLSDPGSVKILEAIQ